MQTTSDHTTVPASDNVAPDEFDKASMAGWSKFTKFLLVNVILCGLGLILVGALTVWS